MATDNKRQRQQQQQQPKKRTAKMARRGLKTLILAVAFPAACHVISTRNSSWALSTLSALSGSLMGLCAWLVWAEGGFHQKPMGLFLFLAHLLLSLVWDRVGFFGGDWVGISVSLAVFCTLAACCRVFKRVNPIAGDLAKLCLVWAGFGVVFNIKLLCW